MHSYHLKNLDISILGQIKDLFNMCLENNYVSVKRLDGVFRPTVKNKFRDAASSDDTFEYV